MIIVDTNVVSEIMKPTPAQVVQDWVRARGSELYTTSITLAEIRYGIERQPTSAVLGFSGLRLPHRRS